MMSFLQNIFHKEEKRTESVVLVDISTDSVAGAYAQYKEGETPALLYTRRLPIEAHADESPERAMFRALNILGKDLIREGAPALARVTGSGTAGTIIVSVGEPWQETSVRTEHFDADEPFTFTKNLVEKRLAETGVAPSEKLLADESIIGTILNGYATHNPYGQEAHRASVVVLTSLVERHTANGILATLQSLYHTKRIFPIASDSLHYQAIRAAFPHERDALIITAFGSVVSLALVRRGLLITTIDIPNISFENASWALEVINQCAEIAKQYPLPRTIFLLAREADLPSLRASLETPSLNALWLSNNPPRIIPVVSSHIVGLVRYVATTPPDLLLLLMALYFQYRPKEEGV